MKIRDLVAAGRIPPTARERWAAFWTLWRLACNDPIDSASHASMLVRMHGREDHTFLRCAIASDDWWMKIKYSKSNDLRLRFKKTFFFDRVHPRLP